jgi:AcrR family transcriptional regulator
MESWPLRPTNPRPDAEPNGHALRSGETRAKLVEAAIEVFAAVGYDGASTRALAQRAGASLAAIPYHFGGKRELYIAAAQKIASHVHALMEPVVTRMLDRDGSGAAERIDEGVSGFIRIIVGGNEPTAWVSFFLRCEHEADDAFRTIYDEVIVHFQRALMQTAAEAMGYDPANEELRIRVTMVVASILSFRTLHNMTLSGLGWDDLTPSRLERLDRAIRQIAQRELLDSSLAARVTHGEAGLQIQPSRQPEAPQDRQS